MPTFMESYMPSLTTISFSGRKTNNGCQPMGVRLSPTKKARAGGSNKKVGYTKQHTMWSICSSLQMCLKINLDLPGGQTVWKHPSHSWDVPTTGSPLRFLQSLSINSAMSCLHIYIYINMLPGWLYNTGPEWEESTLEARLTKGSFVYSLILYIPLGFLGL